MKEQTTKRQSIQRVLNYIEDHLKEDRAGVLDNATLAQVAGYSEYHFLRVFHEIVRLTPAEYVCKRRISEIVCHIGEGNRPISDIAFEYGFNSKENFTRAFKKEHRILPTEFRKANCSLRLYAPFDTEPSNPNPQVSIGYVQAFSLIAYPCDEQRIPNFWNKYNAEKRSERLSGGKVTKDYGVMIWNGERDRLDYWIGIRSEEAKGDLSGTVRLEIQGGLYAIFDTPPATQHHFIETVRHTWDWIYQVWMPGNGYRRDEGFEWECYVEASRIYSERIYVPVIKI